MSRTCAVCRPYCMNAVSYACTSPICPTAAAACNSWMSFGRTVQPKRAMLELGGDRFAMMKAEYEKAGPEPSNTRYGYVVPTGTVDHTLFA